MAEKSKRKGKPKFKVGQVVMRDDGPIKIENVGLHLYGQTGREQYLYGGGGKEAWESQLHPLTRKEKESTAILLSCCPTMSRREKIGRQESLLRDALGLSKSAIGRCVDAEAPSTITNALWKAVNSIHREIWKHMKARGIDVPVSADRRKK